MKAPSFLPVQPWEPLEMALPSVSPEDESIHLHGTHEEPLHKSLL